jgi:hypothetical protein
VDEIKPGDRTAVNNLGEQAVSEAFQRGWIKDYGMATTMPVSGRRVIKDK